MNEKDKNKLFTQLTSNVESDILRLAKTQSYIRTSKELIEDELLELKKRSSDFQDKLKEISIKTTEIENNVGSSEGEVNIDVISSYIKQIREILHESRDYAEYLSKDLDQALIINSEKLNSAENIYMNEMEQLRAEIENRLSVLISKITSTQDNLMIENTEKLVGGIDPNIEEQEYDLEDIKFDDEAIEELGEDDIVEDEDFSNSVVKEFSEPDKSSSWLVIFIILILAALGSGYYFFDEIKISFPSTTKKITSFIESKSTAGLKQKQLKLSDDQDADRKPGDERKKIIGNENTFQIVGEIEYLREGPSIYYDSVAVIKSDEKLESLGEYNGQWLKVRTVSGTEGWVLTRSLKSFNP